MKNTVRISIILILLAEPLDHLHTQEKSTTLALGLSIGVPFAGCVATRHSSPESFLFFFNVTPSLGHFYAGQWGRGLVFIGLRTLVLVGTVSAMGVSNDLYQSIGLFVIGGTVCCTITLIDWIMVPSSVEKYNERFRIEPEIDPAKGRCGIGISHSF